MEPNSPTPKNYARDGILGGCLALALGIALFAILVCCCGLSGDGGQYCDGRGGPDPGGYCY